MDAPDTRYARAPDGAYLAYQVVGAEITLLPGPIFSDENERSAANAFRRFIGVDRPAIELETVLSTVQFTDIVGSTFEDAGNHELKGVSDRWRLYRVAP